MPRARWRGRAGLTRGHGDLSVLRCRKRGRICRVMTKLTLSSVGLLVASVVVGAQGGATPDVLAKIRAEGLERSQVEPVFSELTVAIGPRLTASPAHKRATEFVRDRLTAAGLSNVHFEPWKFGPGWTM